MDISLIDLESDKAELSRPPSSLNTNSIQIESSSQAFPIKKKSKASFRKFIAENPPHPQIEELKSNDTQELLDILGKYANNPDKIPTLNYAVKMNHDLL